MSISMKDLQSSSEDEDDMISKNINNVNEKTETKSVPSSPIKIINTAEEPNSTMESSKTSWIRGQVSGSLKKLTTRMTPTSSLESSFNQSFENNETIHSNPKHSPEMDWQSSAAGITQKDCPSKKDWFRGHINTYFSKRKLSNSSQDILAEDDVSGSLKQDLIEENIVVTSSKSLPDVREINIAASDPSKFGKESSNNQAIESAMNLSSLSSDESHLPLFPKEQSNAPDGSTQIGNTLVQSHRREFSNIKVEQSASTRPKVLKTKLKFSDLLGSATSSPNDTLEEIPVVVPTQSKVKNNVVDEEYIELEIDYLADQIVKEDLQNNLRPNSGTSVTYFDLWLCSIVMYSYVLGIYPAYLLGFFTGFLITYLGGCLLIWFLCPSVGIYDQYQQDLKQFLIDNWKKSTEPQLTKTAQKAEHLAKPRDLKGWMSLTYVFDDSFDKDHSKDVYIVVHEEQILLYVSKKRLEENVKTEKQKSVKNPTKGKAKQQQLCDNPKPIISFEKEIKIDLTKCSLQLKPDDLPIRRIWNKKYPIKLNAPMMSIEKRDIDLSLEDLTLNISNLVEGLDFVDVGTSSAFVSNKEETEIYLFAHTGREKEDWFYRMQLCIMPLKHQVTAKDTQQPGGLTDDPAKSYPHYMCELVRESEKVMQRNVKGKKMEPYLAWLNIFLGRAFWDFWHDKYWTDKLHQKIQSRLSKINTPPFITDITLKELNCGHNIPIIHKGSVPVLDEYGIWSDLQITYKGYFTLTLETQLNVDYYIDVVSSIVKQKGNSKDTSVQLSRMSKSSDTSISGSSEELNMNESVSDMDYSSEFPEDLPDVYFDAFDGPENSIDQEMIDPVMADPRTKAFLESRAGKKIVGLVGWLAKSKLAKKVAESDFAKKACERAYEKFRKMPIILKVEVQSVKGNLAVNIPPPPTNRLWFGFRNNPVIFITASPKVGDKQVRLTYLTSWIERKLKEEFKKVLVLPSMQDISIKLMDSQLGSLFPDRPKS